MELEDYLGQQVLFDIKMQKKNELIEMLERDLMFLSR